MACAGLLARVEDLQQAKKRLEFIVPVSLMLIVALLYALFNSLRDTLLSLAGIPAGVIGGVWALWLTGQLFSISAAIAFVSLLGVSVMNSILLLTFYNQARGQGLVPAEAIYHAATKRMRPLLSPRRSPTASAVGCSARSPP